MIGLYERSSARLQAVPILVAAGGVCVGALLARGQWVYALGIVAAFAIFIWPVEATLGVYGFLLPFDSISRLGESPDGRTLTWYVGAMTTLVLLGVGLAHNKFTRIPRTALYWVLLLAWGALSVFWALDENAVLDLLPTAFGLLGLYLVAAGVEISERQFLRLRLLVIAGGWLASTFSIATFLSGVSTIEARSSLIAGSQQADPNIYAASLLLPLALAVTQVLCATQLLEKITMLSVALTIAAAVLLTMSRGAVLALLSMAIVYSLRYKRRYWIVLSAGLLPLALAAAPSTLWSRFQAALATGGAGRVDIWTAGFVALKRFWIWGAGLSNFPVAYQQFAGFAPIFRGYDRPAHNIYLQVAVELGIVGIGLLLGAVIWQFRDLWNAPRTNSGRLDPGVIACEAAITGMLISAFFVGLLWQKSFWMVWIVCALTARIVRRRAQALPAYSSSVATVFDSGKPHVRSFAN